ncbi:GDSL-type esterase/lipase family protein [Hymenobacter tenuis]
MKKSLLFLALSTLPLGTTQAQTGRSLLVDFGPNDRTNGVITASPDANGNHWNNVLNQTGVTDTFRLVDKANAATGIKVKVGANFRTNGILNGGLLSPSPELLGQYAVATATQDYFYVEGTGASAVATLTMNGFDRGKRYVFHVFGSRQTAAETRVSRYKFTGANESSITQTTSGANVGANSYPGNNNTITTSDTLMADGKGVIVLELSKTTGSFGYLNLMRIDEVPGRGAPLNTAFQNLGFEQGNFTSWMMTPVNAATISTTTPHTGTYAAQLSGGPLQLSQQVSYVNIIGTLAHQLSGYFYAPAALQSGQSAHLELRYLSSTNALLGTFRSDSLTASSPPGTWLKVEATATIPAGTAFVQAAAVWRNPAGPAGSVLFDDLMLAPYQPPLVLNPLKLVYMGSSVPTGTGATNNNGYTSIYSSLLAQRAAAGTGQPWVTANISVPGNNTLNVLDRYERDLLPQQAKYVVFALALGNEGILGGGQPIFDQFRTNMTALIRRARADGMVPVVTNTYTRNDYTATEYAFVKHINLLIHGWNVPSVNLLGAVDDVSGLGHWAPGYWSDALHPNDRGHQELAYTLVPSLFDALKAGKPLPSRRPTATNKGITLAKTTGQPTTLLRLEPEEAVHPFTQAIRFKTSSPGRLIEIRDSAGIAAGTISIASNGKLLYTSAKGRSIAGTVKVDNNRWHKLVLTHFYARGRTHLYVDSVLEGSAAERLRPTRFELGGGAAPARVQLRDWLFYRAGMNQDEVRAMAADSLLKSSLELYAPLDGGTATDSLQNLAQSLNTLVKASGPVALNARSNTQTAQVILYPNPTTGLVRLAAPWNLENVEVQLFNVLGTRVLATRLVRGIIQVGQLPSGVYFLQLPSAEGILTKRLVVQ